MVHSQYCHFSSGAVEGAEAMVLPTRDHNYIGCFNLGTHSSMSELASVGSSRSSKSSIT
jgi:hypothetical protein